MRIADLGSGNGRLVWVVARLGHKAIGMEIDPGLVKITLGSFYDRMPEADYYIAYQEPEVLEKLPLREVGALTISLSLPNSATTERYILYERTDR